MPNRDKSTAARVLGYFAELLTISGDDIVDPTQDLGATQEIIAMMDDVEEDDEQFARVRDRQRQRSSIRTIVRSVDGEG